jgi:ribonuclease HI
MNDKFEFLKIYFDGGSRGNPGPSAIGAVVYDQDDKKVGQVSEYIGKHTNNIAEYISLEKVLEYISRFETSRIILLTDSKLVHHQIKKIWKIKDKKILDIYLKLTKRLSDYSTVDLRLIPREENAEADKLVNEALDRKEFTYDGESDVNFGVIED